jgi:hypothetical protein
VEVQMLGRLMAYGAAALIATTLAGWVLSGGLVATIRAPLEEGYAEQRAESRAESRGRAPSERRARRLARRAAGGPARPAAAEPEPGPLGRVASGLWALVRWPLLVLVLFVGAILAARARERYARRMVRLKLVLYRSDEATPAEVRRLLEGLHQELQEDWWRRPLIGQAGVALEISCRPGRGGPEVEYLIACPDDPRLVAALDAKLLTAYPDARLEPLRGARSYSARAFVRMKKRHVFIRRLRTPDERHPYEHPLADALVAAMAAAQEPVLVQLHLTPTPASFDRVARAAFRSSERSGFELASETRTERSELRERELEGGLEVQHRPLFFLELRVAAASAEGARQVARTLQGESGAENRLVDRRTVVRRSLYRRRLVRALGNPLPSWLHGVVSSSELAALWQAPSPFFKGVPMERSQRPRVPAPPQVLRPPAEEALGRDARGLVGIHTEDRARNVAVLGVPGMGKSAFLCRGIAADARDANTCVIVLDPKGDLHDAALSAIPEGRATSVVAFDRPELGINPFKAEGGLAAVADGIVEAFKTIHLEGSIQASSERYIHDAALAVAAVEEDPSFQDMYRVLLPDEEAYRAHLAKAISGDAELISAANFLGKQLPVQLREAKAAFLQRTDAPLNKIQELIRPKADALFRHPVSLNIDRAIRERRCVVVNGACGVQSITEAGLQLVMTMVHQSLVRQQLGVPEAERVRVCLYIDEAHMLFSETFVRMLAMDRSAGLTVMAAWQSLNQIAEPEVRRQVLDFLRHYVVFQVGKDDARELATIFQTAHTDRVSDALEERRRALFAPDGLANMAVHHAAARFVCRGAPAPGFVLETIPMSVDPARIVGHQEAQRVRDGAYFHGTPEVSRFKEGERGEHEDLPMGGTGASGAPDPGNGAWAKGRRPAPEATRPPGSSVRDGRRPGNGARAARQQGGTAPEGHRTSGATKPMKAEPSSTGTSAPDRQEAPERQAESAASSAGTETESARGEVLAGDPAASSEGRPTDRVTVAALGSEVPGPAVPDAYTELDVFERATGGLSWDGTPPKPPDRVPRPSGEELEIIAALGELRFLYAPQVARHFMVKVAPRTVRHRLGIMFKNGWVRRFHVRNNSRGQSHRIYCLTKEGFLLGQQHSGERGHFIRPEREWREPQVIDPRRGVIHDLHLTAWLFAFRAIAGPTLKNWRGPATTYMKPPKVRRPREGYTPMSAGDIKVGSSQRVDGLAEGEFRPVHPDLRLTMGVSIGRKRIFDLMVELDRSRKAHYNLEKFAAYDALLTGWALEIERYQKMGEVPAVVFVCEDEERARLLAEAADSVMTGTIVTHGVPETEWARPGRRRVWFACERDVHMGTLRAYRLPVYPPEVRKALGEPKRPELEQREFIDSEYLRRHAR